MLNCGVLLGSILESVFLQYVNGVPQALPETGSYLYANNTYVSYKYKYFEKIEVLLNKKFSSLC